MARTTVADLLERLEAMQEEIDSLRKHIDDTNEAKPAFSWNIEVRPPNPISEPLDFHQMAVSLAESQAYGSDEWWGANRYL